MDILKRKATLLFIITTFLLSQHLLFADGEFNEFATCIYKKDIKGIKELLAKGVDVNIREKTMGSTPLIVACSIEGTFEIVELLLAKGADVNIKGTYDGRTALMWAAENSQKTVELLLEKGAEVNVKGVDGMTAFIQSIFGILSGSVTTAVCDLLLEKGSNVNDQLTGADATGWTAIMFASSNGKLDLVKYLISKGADVNLRAKDGTSALSLALKDKNEEIIKILKANGAKE
jgi:ankyrin repeat protein